MGEVFEGWTSWVEDAHVVCKPEHPECLKHHYITRTENDEPRYTIDEEIAMMNKQIEESEGFDIDYSLFRCLFNYHLVDLDDNDFVDEPETNGEFMKILSQEALKRYNEESDTKFEFLEVVKANFHWATGYMFLITFDVLDPSDNQKKPFQARIRYASYRPTEYVFCRPKPDKKVGYNSSSDEDVKGITVGCNSSSDEDVKGITVGCNSSSDEDAKGITVGCNSSSDEDAKGIAVGCNNSSDEDAKGITVGCNNSSDEDVKD